MIITNAKETLGLSDRRGFRSETLVLEVCGPDQEHLTLIDLPGYFVSTRDGQLKTDIKLVEDIANSYILKDRAIVLAVVSAQTDLENQTILETIKENEKLRERTLGIITAPDTLKQHTHRQKSYTDLLYNNPRNFGHGWHVLRNPDHDEWSKSGFDRDEAEKSFFNEHEPWKGMKQPCLGSTTLKKKLARMLRSNIAQSLPEIQKEIETKLSAIIAELTALGDKRTTPRELRTFLCEKARSFEQEIKSRMTPEPPDSLGPVQSDRRSLRSIVQQQYKSFADEMYDNSALWTLYDSHIDSNAIQNLEVLGAIYAGLHAGTQKVYGHAMSTLLLQEMSWHRGKSLDTLLDPKWVPHLFRRLSQRWQDIARMHTDAIFNEVHEQTTEAVRKAAGEEIAERLLADVVWPRLQHHKQLLRQKLRELFQPFEDPNLHSLSRLYLSKVNIICPINSTTEEQQSYNILRNAQAFYELSLEIYIQNVADLGVENCLLKQLPRLLSQEDFLAMSDEELETFGGESEDLENRRNCLQGDKARFEGALKHILPRLRTTNTRVYRPGREHSGTSIPTAGVSVEVTGATPPLTPIPDTPTRTPFSAQRTFGAVSSGHQASSPTPSDQGSSVSFSHDASAFSSPAHSRTTSNTSYQGSPSRAEHSAKEDEL